MARSAIKINRPRRDDLPAVHSSQLVKQGLIQRDSTHVEITFGEGADALKRTVGVAMARFRWNGGYWAYFLCPTCLKLAQTLRLLDGALVCRKCDGLLNRCQAGDDNGGRIARLEQRLYGEKPAARRRRALEASLRAAHIKARRARAYV